MKKHVKFFENYIEDLFTDITGFYVPTENERNLFKKLTGYDWEYNLTIPHDISLSFDGIRRLPDNLTIDGFLDLCNNKNLILPNNLTVNKWLDLRQCELKRIPDNLKVLGDLDIRRTGLTKKDISQSVIIGGDIITGNDPL